MILFEDCVQSFDEFCERNAGNDSPIFEAYITERGIVIPQSEWRKLPTNMRNSRTGLNFGKDEEETIYKFADKAGSTGQVGSLNVPIDVRIDQTSHAANQIYRWEHRFDQVDQEEILSDVRKAAPAIIELILNGKMKVGTGWNPEKNTEQNYEGQVWIKNSDTMLNTIVQAKGRESKNYPLKLLVVTVLRKKEMSLSRRDLMPKIVVGDTHDPIVVAPSA